MGYCGALAALLVSGGAGAATNPGTWTEAPALPTPCSAHAVVVAAGAIHALGGPGSTRIDRFDGRRWRRDGAQPGGVLNAPAAVAIGRSVYVIGGFRGATNVPTAKVRVLDTPSQRWRDVVPIPAPRGGHAAVVLGGRIHLLGGGNSVSTIADHSVYDPATNSWSNAAPLPRPEGSPAAVVLRGRIYVIGGRSGLEGYGPHSCTTHAPTAGREARASRRAGPPEQSCGAARSTSSEVSPRRRARCCRTCTACHQEPRVGRG